jgi:hypothetical protein
VQGGIRGIARLTTTLARSHIGGVVTISITAEALAAIEATLPEGREADRRRELSDVILRLATAQ